ncbi:MAG: 50S ribosomal protein L15 [Cytophagaceae bacterium]
MNLSSLKPASGSVKNRKRIGRGTGSGRGGTSTKGHKGAQSRSGYSVKIGFEGGQMPLQRRIPKFGFNRPNRVVFKPINLDVLQTLAEKISSEVIDLDTLVSNGLMSKNDKVKVLGRGEISKKLDIKVHAFSSSAVKAIEKAGGKATTI